MQQASIEKQNIVLLVQNTNTKYYFKNDSQTIKFDGFLKMFPSLEESTSVDISNADKFVVSSSQSKQHFTLAPARFNDASIVKTLEKFGIGRPSTYASIISILLERGYVTYNDAKCFEPTDIGIKTSELLSEHFKDVSDYDLTCKIEDQLDKVALNKTNWQKLLQDFYTPFKANLDQKNELVQKIDLIKNEATNEKCPECNADLIFKMSRFGKFMACPNFPKCKYTKSINELNIDCPKCKVGKLVRKVTKRKKVVYGCNQYPKCDFIVNKKPLDKKCPQCGYPLIAKNKNINKCSNKDCSYDTSA